VATRQLVSLPTSQIRIASPPTLEGSVWLKKFAIMANRIMREAGRSAPHRLRIRRQRKPTKKVCAKRTSTPSAHHAGSIRLRRPATVPRLTRFSAK